MNYLTVDFGSTYTKLTAINTDTKSIEGTASAFTTIETDIMNGFECALLSLEKKIGKKEYDQILCCSSAGGGLKMVALGLVPELTSKAAMMAASSAGAKVMKTYAFEISKDEQQEIYDLNPDLVLLCGGTDGGNKEVIVANAKRLCDIKRNFSVIVAGNKSASYELDEIFKTSDKNYVITKNVMPVFNKLDIYPAKACIMDLFIQNIIEAKGLSKAQAMASNEIIPTPLAVMNGCELLSRGTKKMEGMGEFMAVDLGGATTDIYSMATGKPRMESVIEKGLPEEYSKRTVEGDLGMRYSLLHLTEQVDLDALPDNMEKEKLETWVQKCISNPDLLAEVNSTEKEVEELLAQHAIRIAVERHCGTLESAYTPMGEIFALSGKDLTEIPYVIGIGGSIINSEKPSSILDGSKYDMSKYNLMKPKNPQYLLDKKYIFASMGLLSQVDAELALKLMKENLTKVEK